MSAADLRHKPRSTPLWAYVLVLAAAGSLLLGLSLWWNLRQHDEGIYQAALTLARTSLEKDVLYRRWSARLGGVYALITPDTPPNPYLQVPERDIITPSGRRLTLINPAYMTRQVHELGAKALGVRGRITSLKPLRPANQADPWERGALLQAEQGAPEVHQVLDQDGRPVLRLLLPLPVEGSCLPCHVQQGYRLGQVRGGLSATVPLGPLLAMGRQEVSNLWLTHLLLWVVGLAALGLGAWSLQRRIIERDRARDELQTLSGLLPICSRCKKIRDQQGRWQQMERYIQARSQADFTHSLCPACAGELYPEMYPEAEKPEQDS
ncbi:MAG: DUF3365 domain-containing protein [Desulfarculus sp.]|nr:MAG: DUF3365 domain-containing protein [Desulfarculus sp.]